MSLYVNAALTRTHGGHVFAGHRAVSSRKLSSLLKAGNRTKPLRPSHASFLTHHRAQTQEARCGASTSGPSVSTSTARNETTLHLSQLRHYAAHSQASVASSSTLYPTPDISNPQTNTVERRTRSSTKDVPTQEFVTLESAAVADHSILQNTSQPSNNNRHRAHRLYAQASDNANETLSTNQQRQTAGLGTAERCLPRDQFRERLRQISALHTQGKGSEYLRGYLSDMVGKKDMMLQDHGNELRAWLDGAWDSHKAVQVMEVVLGSLVTSPQEFLTVMQSLRAVEDEFFLRARCLRLASKLYKDSLVSDAKLRAAFRVEVGKLRSPDMWPKQGIRRLDFDFMLWGMSDKDAEKLIRRYLKRQPEATVEIRRSLAAFCVHHKLDPLALSLLTSLPLEELHSPSRSVLTSCHVLIGRDVVESTAEGTNFKYLPQLLEHGLTPDSMLYSQIIERAFESGYASVAWDVFRHLQAKDVSITDRTYFLLLRHAFNDNNVAGVQEIMSEIQRTGVMRTSLPLLHYSYNIIRRIFRHERAMTGSEALTHLLALYDQLFTREPLVRLGILASPASETFEVETSVANVRRGSEEPPAFSLAVMVWAHVLCHRSGRHTQELWKRIRELVEAGDKAVVESMAHDVIYNAFIWLNLRESGTMAAALDILHYMLAKQLCMPTDRTWSILICGFLRQNQKAQAQQIFTLMRQCDLGLSDIRQEYWRRGWTFEYFVENLDEILDEDMMPDGTETGSSVLTAKPIFPRNSPGSDRDEHDEFL